jgi:hypothetical protein
LSVGNDRSEGRRKTRQRTQEKQRGPEDFHGLTYYNPLEREELRGVLPPAGGGWGRRASRVAGPRT